MTKIIIGVGAIVIVACFGLPMLLLSAVMGGGSSGCSIIAAPAVRPTGQPSNTGTWDAEQVEIAATIIDVGVTKSVPRWGWVIALATAMQESGLRNLPHLGDRNDHDSIGVFQQRPSQGWGTHAQLTEPAYQAGKFFDKLLTVPGWEAMPLTQAAQTVQVSAFPDAYAQWTDDALHLVEQLTSTIADCATDTFAALPDGFALPANTPPAVAAAIFWAVNQLGTPYHFGGSCTDPHSGDPAKQCDCSSLVQAAYRAAGITIPRVTTDQANTGKPVTSPALLLPGDLILIPGSARHHDQPTPRRHVPRPRTHHPRPDNRRHRQDHPAGRLVQPARSDPPHRSIADIGEPRPCHRQSMRSPTSCEQTGQPITRVQGTGGPDPLRGGSSGTLTSDPSRPGAPAIGRANL